MIRCFECGLPAGDSDGQGLCGSCGGLLEVVPPPPQLSAAALRDLFTARRGSWESADRSGVWRYRELVDPSSAIVGLVSRPEGNTNLYSHPEIDRFVGAQHVLVKHEGENPTGSFKDRGMTVAVTVAQRSGARAVVCASTGNTAASLASYASFGGLPAIVVVPKDHTAPSKLAQSIAFGARVAAVRGSFDDALVLAEAASRARGLALLNSVNPWRIEGQKSIIFELCDQLGWEPPDWIVFPAGNLGNTSAFGKALDELERSGLIDRRPRLVAVQAEGAAPFFRLFHDPHRRFLPEPNPETIASAIRIGDPRSWKKALRAIDASQGTVLRVSDQELLDAKVAIDACGIGCEPASAASLAGARALVAQGTLRPHERIVCILTGNFMKDAATTVAYHEGGLAGISSRRANRPREIDATMEAFDGLLDTILGDS